MSSCPDSSFISRHWRSVWLLGIFFPSVIMLLVAIIDFFITPVSNLPHVIAWIVFGMSVSTLTVAAIRAPVSNLRKAGLVFVGVVLMFVLLLCAIIVIGAISLHLYGFCADMLSLRDSDSSRAV